MIRPYTPADREQLLALLGLELLGQHVGQCRSDRRGTRLPLRQISLSARFAEVQLLRLASGQLGDVKRRGLLALLTFHRRAFHLRAALTS